MRVRILYFASLRDALKTASECVDLPDGIKTAGGLRDWLAARDDRHAAAFAPERPIRMSVAQVMATPDTPLTDDAEVAFFPPVTGG